MIIRWACRTPTKTRGLELCNLCIELYILIYYRHEYSIPERGIPYQVLRENQVENRIYIRP
jgi:hypothetical protein